MLNTRNRVRLLVAVATLLSLILGSGASGLAHEGEDHDATPAPSPGINATQTELSHPAHIHQGSCDCLDPEPLYGLVQVRFPSTPAEAPEVNGSIPVITSTTTVDRSLADVLAGEHAIDIHVDAEQTGAILACGTIGGTPSERDLSIGLQEQNSSAHAGIAWLHDNGDGTTTITIFLAHGLAVSDGHANTVVNEIGRRELMLLKEFGL